MYRALLAVLKKRTSVTEIYALSTVGFWSIFKRNVANLINQQVVTIAQVDLVALFTCLQYWFRDMVILTVFPIWQFLTASNMVLGVLIKPINLSFAINVANLMLMWIIHNEISKENFELHLENLNNINLISQGCSVLFFAWVQRIHFRQDLLNNVVRLLTGFLIWGQLTYVHNNFRIL